MRPVRGILKLAGIVLLLLVLVLAHGWAMLALRFCISPDGLAYAVVAGYALVAAVAMMLLLKRRRSMLWTLILVAGVALWFSGIEAQPGGTYPPETSVAARATFDGKDGVTLHGVRNFHYRSETDFDVRWEDRSYRLDEVRTLDAFFSYWGLEQVAHTMLSFGFADGQQLAVSVEIRRETDETYDTLRGIFKQYELIYVWADERDVILLRPLHRREQTRLYRTTLPPDQVRLLLTDMLEETNRLAGKPEFYNTVTRNCTSSLVGHINAVLPHKVPWWDRRLRNGFGDKRALDAGFIAASGSFEDIRRDADISERARAAGDVPEFSQRIRARP